MEPGRFSAFAAAKAPEIFLRAGELFLSYFIWYSIGRFFIEGLRTDSLAFDGPAWLKSIMDALWSPMTVLFEPGNMAYGNVRISQLLAVIIVAAAVIIIVARRKKWDMPIKGIRTR